MTNRADATAALAHLDAITDAMRRDDVFEVLGLCRNALEYALSWNLAAYAEPASSAVALNAFEVAIDHAVAWACERLP